MSEIDTPQVMQASTSAAQNGEKKPRKRFVGAKPGARGGVRRVANQVPDEILNDPALKAAMAALPQNYNFEIPKTIHHVRREGVRTVALQMPEGLMMYGTAIADIIERFTGALPLLLADVTYGACCIDDFTAREMGAEMIVHYGHSCLIPVNQTSIKTLYVFVEIAIDAAHLALSVRRNFPSSRAAFERVILGAGESEPGAKVDISLEGEDMSASEDAPTRLALVGTIQFVAAVQALKEALSSALPPLDTAQDAGDDALAKVALGEIGVWRGMYDISVPQVRPLSPGEILGCTAPKLGNVDALIYVGDGRFHLESIMIANPAVPAFRYDPYSKKFTREGYEHAEMRGLRGDAVRTARQNLESRGSGSWAVLLGTLGRQGSLSVLENVQGGARAAGGNGNGEEEGETPLLVLLSELSPQKLALFSEDEISTFVQTSCPRLSIDWGYAFSRPLLSPYEASVASGRVAGWEGVEVAGAKGTGDYPMDFYADASLGPWTPRHRPPREPKPLRESRVA
ncbi:hypothetical protein CcaverHIS002_0509880 [Cutaneotrichosporon cavernicola]|uniref:2-(3-amino-3-carboxypropyl)histidine synthase subunit 1 n=1 Tax=Cutaneotrichosporon cavernicola TaxID=279322 RepID=A0AA48L7P0_9TREE|nr:uncharacterized protein CcaverHIS019_0510440 [Cutaneotrichosporon cavernicola]BEI85587.1 hypothetical protein CcaverHIS002_0509880 [Cutaneotrichosporon cavernicola]BEI93416.1 hypothetical protein CcaverHIS019_0510440 [Cutaneotrichosporon cavernicola]BEJ01194.1 hypothetical protein CcaverHIS631_0510510 [Cutaneotrichosporon cavernicola]BEJ08962.1 hypothetical protein CcaverHIS641_0510560 [Cutaneotrichosporon cavernicola]